MRPVLVVLLEEGVQARLLLQGIRGGGLGRFFSKGLSNNIRRGLLAQEEQSCLCGEPADLFGDLESPQLRQVDHQAESIRLQFFGLLNAFQSIRRFDRLELRPFLKRRTNETAKRCIVLDDENPQQRHIGGNSVRCERKPLRHTFRNPESQLVPGPASVFQVSTEFDLDFADTTA